MLRAPAGIAAGRCSYRSSGPSPISTSSSSPLWLRRPSRTNNSRKPIQAMKTATGLKLKPALAVFVLERNRRRSLVNAQAGIVYSNLGLQSQSKMVT